MKPIPVNNKYLISVQRPHLWIITVLVILLVIALLFWVAFDYGRKSSGFYLAETESQIELLEAEIIKLRKRNEELNREKTRLARDHSIEKDASGKVTKTLTEKQAQILEMKEELTFYKSIVKPGSSKLAIVIKKVDFKSTTNDAYTYKITLGHEGGRLGALSRGVVQFFIKGESSDGQQQELDWSQLSLSGAEKREKFGFKFFQDFEGSIRFPEGFKPISVHIHVMPSSSQMPKVEQEYAWEKLISGGE